MAAAQFGMGNPDGALPLLGGVAAKTPLLRARPTQNKGLDLLLSSVFHTKFFRSSQATANLTGAKVSTLDWSSPCSRESSMRERCQRLPSHGSCVTAINSKERGQMNIRLKTLATLALVSALYAGRAQTPGPGNRGTSSATHKH